MAQKRKRNKKWIYWLLLAVLLAVAAVMTFLVWDSYFNDKKENKQGEQEIERIEGEKNDKKTGSNADEKDEAEKAVEEKKVEQYEGEDPNMAGELSGVVTYAGVVDGKLMIRVNIDQYLESGECRLTLVRGGGTIYSSIAEIMGGPSTASCAGFDVPVNELGEGVIDININISADERSGVIRGEASI